MAKPGAARRRKDESDDDSDVSSVGEVDLMEGGGNAASPASVDGEEAGNDDAPSTPVPNGKRKRAAISTPSTQQEEAELARRRRRRQSLVFQKRRQSLTPSKAATTAGANEPNRQYISDMYSTIIKMSSENKINSKNTWSLHLIDHMEDILSAPHAEPTAGATEDDANTFNFQKASCTLDASIKIYSYRVDDTWTSSYKILENLSRSGNDKRGADPDDDDGDVEAAADNDGGGEDEEGAPQRRGKKKTNARRGMNAARTIEKNLNNITVKSFDVDFEPDPLFHKMSQTFDEGGAKGMLLANLSVYDGAKVLLNSADVKLSTRKLMLPAKTTDDGEPDKSTPAEQPYKSTKISLASLGKLSCFTKDVRSVAVCPPLNRLYEQIEDMRDREYTQSKVVLKASVLTLAPRRVQRDTDDDGSSAPFSPIRDDVSVENGDEAPAAESSDDAPLDDTASADEGSVENGSDAHMEDGAADADDDDDNNEADDQGFDFDGGGDDVDMGDDADTAASVDESVEDVELDVASVDEDHHNLSELDPVTERQVDPIAYSRADSQPVIVKSAADYFRQQMEDEGLKKEEDVAYSQLIETALMRSVVLETDGTVDFTQSTDYSYFDSKMLKNWAGPSHYKFKPRKITAKLLAFDEEVDGAAHEGGATGRRRKSQAKKPKDSVAAAEKRSLFVDFLSPDVPDLAKLLRPAHLDASTVQSKLIVRKQMQKAAELVFPVDVHIESKIFFRHFMKPRLHLFHRRALDQPSNGGSGPRIDDGAHLMLQTAARTEAGLADTDHLAYEDDGNYVGHDFGGDDFSDGDSDTGGDDLGGGASGSQFTQVNLIAAERVVEKIDVHYERVAKRVDVKKLKTSLWSHLESETGLLGNRPLLGKRQRQRTSDQPEPEATEEEDAEANADVAQSLPETTTFDNVVHSIADKVPSNVTVSFYFICMLHLANEKGLRLTGQDDLSDFVIKKEEPLVRS